MEAVLTEYMSCRYFGRLDNFIYSKIFKNDC